MSEHRKSEVFRRAAETNTIAISGRTARLLECLARIDECITDICGELNEHYGNDDHEAVVSEAYGQAYETIKREVSEVLMYNMIDSASTACI